MVVPRPKRSPPTPLQRSFPLPESPPTVKKETAAMASDKECFTTASRRDQANSERTRGAKRELFRRLVLLMAVARNSLSRVICNRRHIVCVDALQRAQRVQSIHNTLCLRGADKRHTLDTTSLAKKHRCRVRSPREMVVFFRGFLNLQTSPTS